MDGRVGTTKGTKLGKKVSVFALTVLHFKYLLDIQVKMSGL